MGNTGKYNRRITIVTPGAMTADGIGGFVEGTPTTKEVWCSAMQLSMFQALSYGLETTYASYRFKFIYYSATSITQATRLIYEGRTFRIHRVENVDEAKGEVIVITSEQK